MIKHGLILRRGWSDLWRYPSSAFVVGALWLLVLGLLGGGAVALELVMLSAPPLSRLAVGAGVQVVGALIATAFLLGCTRWALAVADGEPGYLSLLANPGAPLLPAVVTSVLAGALGNLGVLACFIPGLLIYVCFALWTYFQVDRAQGPIASLKSSVDVVRPALGWFVGLAFALGLAFVVPFVPLVMAVPYLFFRWSEVAALVVAACLLVSCFVGPWTFLCWAHGYREASGLFAKHQRRAAPPRSPAPEPGRATARLGPSSEEQPLGAGSRVAPDDAPVAKSQASAAEPQAPEGELAPAAEEPAAELVIEPEPQPVWVSALAAALITPLVIAGGSPLAGIQLGDQLAQVFDVERILVQVGTVGALFASGLATWAVLWLSYRGRRRVVVDEDGFRFDATRRWPGTRLRFTRIAAFRLIGEGVQLLPERSRLPAWLGPIVPSRERDTHFIVEELERRRIPRVD
ncbi:MAG: hypothetical protein AB7N76_31315 [Planctomycetota bacterium]